jgi:hypothetical protein
LPENLNGGAGGRKLRLISRPEDDMHTVVLQIVSVAAVVVAGLVLQAAPARSQSRTVGEVAEIRGAATGTRQGARPRTLELKGDVFFRDTLRTGNDARLVAQFDDGTKLTLGDSANVVIDTFVYDPNRSIGQMAARVAGGAFLFVGGRIEDQARASVRIRTPLATLGIRGTTVWGGPIDGAYGVLVLSGRVDVRTSRGTVTLREGQGTTLRPRRSPEPIVVWGADKVRRAIESVTVAR